jgi:hypothetical protein
MDDGVRKELKAFIDGMGDGVYWANRRSDAFARARKGFDALSMLRQSNAREQWGRYGPL